MQTLFPIALIAHIVGITFMAGTTLVEYLLMNHFWKLFKNDRSKAIASYDTGFNFHLLVDIGVTLLILSGVVMLIIFQGVFIKQIWFQIKIGLIIIIAINGTLIGRKNDKKLNALLSLEKLNLHKNDFPEQENLKEDFISLKQRLNLFYISQLLMFLTIFTLSIFKFN